MSRTYNRNNLKLKLHRIVFDIGSILILRRLYRIYKGMRARADRRVRQKISRPPLPSFRIDNDYNPDVMPQYFQISVNILDARKLVWSNPQSTNSYVVVVLGKKKHRTTVRRNMEEPYYGENFLFEMYVSIRDIQSSSLWLAVMEPRCCSPPRLLGETTIDLGAIWAQPYHQVYHKWAQLSLPRDLASGPVGFLKVDISIIFRGEIQVMPAVVSNQKLEDNLLLPSTSEQQRAHYLVTVYGAFGLPCGTLSHNDRRCKLPSTFVRVSFCGLVAKTAVQHRTNNPMFYEQVSIVEMFPNLNQMIKIEVCSMESGKVLASTELRLGELSHDGENGFLPTFGPSLLHMYGTSAGSVSPAGEDGPFHRGSLLVSLKTVVPYYQQGVRSISVEPAVPIRLGSLWQQEDFCVIGPILEVSMLDRRVVGKICGVAITIGDIPSDRRPDEDFAMLMSELRARKLHYTGSLNVVKTRPAYGYLNLPNGFPVLQLATRLPDFRFRMYRNNMIYGIVADLELALQDVEQRLKNFDYTSPNDLEDELNKSIDDAAGNILKFLDIVQYSHGNGEELMQKHSTELDQKQLALQKEEIEKIYQHISTRARGSTLSLNRAVSTYTTNSCLGSRKSVKLLLAETKTLANSLRDIIYKTSEGWPDIIVWLLAGGSRVAFTKISTADIIYSVIPEQCGRNCGRIQTVYVKPLKCPKHVNGSSSNCFCIIAKIEVLLWMGLFRQKTVFDKYLPQGYNLKVRDCDMCVRTSNLVLECRAFIYRAKLVNGGANSSSINAFVRINTLNSVKDTKVKQKTLTPLWNQVLKIQRMVFATADRLINSPPLVLVEIYDSDANVGKIELLGRIQLQPVIDDNQSYKSAPKLQWYEVYKGAEYAGQILMSTQITQVPEKFLKSTMYTSHEETYYAPDAKEIEISSEEVEPLPSNLIPRSASYKVDIYWWGLRDVNITRKPCVVLELDELIIKSDIIVDKKSNCNFPNGRTTHTFECSMNELYSPPLNIRLYDSSTFGRTLFLGTNVVRNPNKYMVNWLPKKDREASLKSASIMSSDFCQVSNVVFMKKNGKSITELDTISSMSVKSSIAPPTKVKRSKLRRFFTRKEPDEEEYTLLPVYVKEKDQIKVVKKSSKLNDHNKDWWLRFFCSQQEYAVGENSENSDLITIYYSELESQPDFSKFKDWCTTLKLYNGKKTGIPEKDEQLHCGFLKTGIAIYRWPPPGNTVAVSLTGVELNRGFFDDHPENNPTKHLVRVYIVRGLNLLAKDSTGKSDPYVVLSCGKKHLGDRSKYVPNTLEPVFGQMYEFRCTLPEEYLLTVSLFDFDAIPPDELIGSTAIDLEDRVYTKHRARVGISAEYNSSGPMKWRDSVKPSTILEDLCVKNHLPPPTFPDSATVIVNGVQYKDSRQDKVYASSAERKENICLSILHKWHTLPVCGYHLVPEHVETRSLFNPDKPGNEQGKIQLWVDIFPLDATSSVIPLPADIAPRKTDEYELRVIIWDIRDLELDSYDGDTGKVWNTAKIYVKGWIGSIEKAQCTDVHKSTSTGEATFNWRMVFRFQYQHAERKILNKEIGPFTEYEEYVTPYLIVQLMEDEADDFFGSLSLNLNRMPRGSKLACHCTLEGMERAKKINLFALTCIRAWWPLKTIDMNTGRDMPAGVIDMELSLLPLNQAILMPVGLGRDPPCPLPEPQRPQRFLSTIKACTPANCKTITTIAAIIWCAAILLMLFYLGTPILLGWIRNEEMHPHKHAEGIIRTLYPVKSRRT